MPTSFDDVPTGLTNVYLPPLAESTGTMSLARRATDLHREAGILQERTAAGRRDTILMSLDEGTSEAVKAGASR